MLAHSKPYYDEAPELRPTSFWNSGFVVQAIEIGILGRPVLVAVTRMRIDFLSVSSASAFFPSDAVGASGVVQRAGIAGAKGHRGLQVTHGTRPRLA
jgi:hypothetical protein